LPLISQQPSLFKKSKQNKEASKCMTPRLPNKGSTFDENQNEFKEDLCRIQQPQLQKVADTGRESLN
jgi:hypothetical protein